MTLNSNALTTVARLAEFMGIDTPASGSVTENKLISRINAISNFIERYTNRTFKKATYTQEEYISERAQTLNLKHYPIISAEPFIIERRNSQMNEGSWETIDGEYYSVDLDSGIVHNMGGIFFFRGLNLYRVTYTAGYDFDNSATFLGDTAAGDVEFALFLIAQDFEVASGTNSNVKSEALGDYKVTYGDIKGTMMKNPDALAILDGWTDDILAGGPLTPLQNY